MWYRYADLLIGSGTFRAYVNLLGFRDSEQYIDFKVNILRIAQRTTVGNHSLRRQWGPFEWLDQWVGIVGDVPRHKPM